jgi:hypothetical protein
LLALPLAVLYAPLAERRSTLSRFVPAASKRRSAALVAARRRGAPFGRRQCA